MVKKESATTTSRGIAIKLSISPTQRRVSTMDARSRHSAKITWLNCSTRTVWRRKTWEWSWKRSLSTCTKWPVLDCSRAHTSMVSLKMLVTILTLTSAQASNSRKPQKRLNNNKSSRSNSRQRKRKQRQLKIRQLLINRQVWFSSKLNQGMLHHHPLAIRQQWKEMKRWRSDDFNYKWHNFSYQFTK